MSAQYDAILKCVVFPTVKAREFVRKTCYYRWNRVQTLSTSFTTFLFVSGFFVGVFVLLLFLILRNVYFSS